MNSPELTFDPIFERPLNELTRSNELADRLAAEIESTDWDKDEVERVEAALRIALDAHSEDMRGPYPYSTHFMRVAIRILSKRHFDIRDNPDLIIAALLHDTVEDHPEYYLEDEHPPENARHLAFDFIEGMFGGNVRRMIADVTNPESDPLLTKAERNVLYRAHVIETIANPSAEDIVKQYSGVIKLSDFIDNCAGLKHNEDPARAVRLAYKYYELIPWFKLFIRENTILKEAKKEMLELQLDKAELRCIDLMSAS